MVNRDSSSALDPLKNDVASLTNDVRAIIALLRRTNGTSNILVSDLDTLQSQVDIIQEIVEAMIFPISVQNGGTGNNFSLTSRGSLFYFSADGVVSALAPGTSGHVLKSGGPSADPSWGVVGTVAGGLGSNFSATAQGSLFYFSAAGVVSALAPGSSGQFLKTQGAGANPTWATIATPSAIPVPLSEGGTGINASTGLRGSLLAFSADGVISVLGPGSSGQTLVSLGGAALPAWTDPGINTRILEASSGGSPVNNTTTKTSIYSYTVPANMLVEKAGVILTLAGELINNTSGAVPATNFRFFVSWAGADRIRTRNFSVVDNAASRLAYLTVELFNNDDTMSQKIRAESTITEAQGDVIVGPPVSLIFGGDVADHQELLTTSSVDQSSNEDLEIFIQFGNANTGIEFTLLFARVEYVAQDI